MIHARNSIYREKHKPYFQCIFCLAYNLFLQYNACRIVTKNSVFFLLVTLKKDGALRKDNDACVLGKVLWDEEKEIARWEWDVNSLVLSALPGVAILNDMPSPEDGSSGQVPLGHPGCHLHCII